MAKATAKLKAPPGLLEALEEFPRFLKEKKRRRELRKRFVEAKFGDVSRRLLLEAKKREKKERLGPPGPPVHPWRLCAAGQHWVKEHARENNPVQGYCRRNPSRKDQLYADEMLEMASKYFGTAAANRLPGLEEFPNSFSFDHLIVGWTKYWNEVLKPTPLLDAKLVKALIASESSFRRTVSVKNRGNPARGLMQVTDQTRAILSNEKGELKDFLVNLSREGAEDPVLNIAAGVRWLFQKRRLASARLKRIATWEEAAGEYKDVLRRTDPKSKKIYADLLKLYGKMSSP